MDYWLEAVARSSHDLGDVVAVGAIGLAGVWAAAAVLFGAPETVAIAPLFLAFGVAMLHYARTFLARSRESSGSRSAAGTPGVPDDRGLTVDSNLLGSVLFLAIGVGSVALGGWLVVVAVDPALLP